MLSLSYLRMEILFILQDIFLFFPDRTERFSLALVFGADSNHIFKNKQIAQKIYNSNYDFLKPPPKPVLNIVPGDKQVTLIWNSKC